jgi:diphosphomevalonate decarboxylase
MATQKATAVSCANIALVKYWGNMDAVLRLPANSSLSMNLGGLTSTTTVAFEPGLSADEVILDGKRLTGGQLQRVVTHLDRVRHMAGLSQAARVVSHNNFPSGAGLASSASGFAALSAAAAAAAGLSMSERELSALARLGSGSASRSVPAGYVEWRMADRHAASYAVSFAPPEHWALVDVIAIVDAEHKHVGSTPGHALAGTSPLQEARLRSTEERFETCRAALLERDFQRLAPVVELEALAMHAVMFTSTPSLIYWAPATVRLVKAVQEWRQRGLPVAFTIDAGPNVHCLCPAQAANHVEDRLRTVSGVAQVLRAPPGGPTQLVDWHLF